jgi:hypothetical protein
MQADSAKQVIAEAHQIEIDKARTLLRDAVEQASDAWISSPAIGDALMLEFIELAGRSASPSQLAEHLTLIAHQLKNEHKRAH